MNLYALVWMNENDIGTPQHLYNDINEAHQEAARRNGELINGRWEVIERETSPTLWMLDGYQMSPPLSSYYISSDGYQVSISNLTSAITITLPPPNSFAMNAKNYTMSAQDKKE